MRKEVLKSTILASAIIGGLSLALLVTAMPAGAWQCPPNGCYTEGRMTGGGRLNGDLKVTHGFELNCSTSSLPNNIEVNCGKGNHFHLDYLTNVKCLDDPSISPAHPAANFDLMEGGGKGSYNGVSGASIYFVFTDAGEPGKNADSARILIRDIDGNTVLDVSATLKGGNYQAHG
jgi:hypothetical protein